MFCKLKFRLIISFTNTIFYSAIQLHAMNEQLSNPTRENEAPREDIFSEIYDLQPYERTLNRARIWLYVIAGLQFIMGIIEYNQADDPTIGWTAFGIDAFIAAGFLILALWSRKKPVPAFTIALVSYIVLITGFMILNPSNLVRGIIIKILVIIALVKANRDARKYEEMKALMGRM